MYMFVWLIATALPPIVVGVLRLGQNAAKAPSGSIPLPPGHEFHEQRDKLDSERDVCRPSDKYEKLFGKDTAHIATTVTKSSKSCTGEKGTGAKLTPQTHADLGACLGSVPFSYVHDLLLLVQL